jgi:hypothetical protein
MKNKINELKTEVSLINHLDNISNDIKLTNNKLDQLLIYMKNTIGNSPVSPEVTSVLLSIKS